MGNYYIAVFTFNVKCMSNDFIMLYNKIYYILVTDNFILL